MRLIDSGSLDMLRFSSISAASECATFDLYMAVHVGCKQTVL